MLRKPKEDRNVSSTELPTYQRIQSIGSAFKRIPDRYLMLIKVLFISIIIIYVLIHLSDLITTNGLVDIRQKTLILVMKTSINQAVPDGIPGISSTWAEGLNVKFLDCSKQPFTTKDDRRISYGETTGDALFYALQTLTAGYKFVMKVDDVTFLRPKALFKYLKQLGPNPGARFLGHRLKSSSGYIFNSGGAGYILTEKAIRLLLENEETPKIFRHRAEDTALAAALRAVGVKPEDTRDSKQADRFHVFEPMTLMGVGGIYRLDDVSWYHKYHWYGKHNVGLDNLSSETISFHYVKAPWMHVLHDRLNKGKDITPVSERHNLDEKKWEKVEDVFSKLSEKV